MCSIASFVWVKLQSQALCKQRIQTKHPRLGKTSVSCGTFLMQGLSQIQLIHFAFLNSR
jgi:hypothetical protein